jgi:UDP-N-acetylmuramate--alanine ligase
VRAGKRVHCIGIGGIGISAIARVLLEQGHWVSGSDLYLSPVAEALGSLGAQLYSGHNASHVGDVDLVLVSSAVPEDNVEIAEAKRRGIPVLKRSAFLGQLMADKVGIAVAGTHGKTTTTSMIVWILVQAKLEPTFIVGGVIRALGTNAHAGRGDHFVIEADEYDRMFLGLKPRVAAITHLEHDHPDCFPTFAHMRAAFEEFVALVPPDGLVVGCADPPAVRELLRGSFSASRQSCGLNAGNDWRAVEVHPNLSGGYDFRVRREGIEWGQASLKVPGLHNVRNALIAAAVADWVGVEPGTACRALSTFAGVDRRFEVVGQVNGITVIDDYGHHPTEIRATLDAARVRYDGRPLWAVLQPHTYSRTKALWVGFCASFGQADHVIVLDVYPAREVDPLGVSAADLAAAIDHTDAQHISDVEHAADYIVSHIEPNAVVVTLSAGDGNQVGRRVLDKLADRKVHR